MKKVTISIPDFMWALRVRLLDLREVHASLRRRIWIALGFCPWCKGSHGRLLCSELKMSPTRRAQWEGFPSFVRMLQSEFTLDEAEGIAMSMGRFIPEYPDKIAKIIVSNRHIREFYECDTRLRKLLDHAIAVGM
jgi:hypothetical protein